MPLAPLEPFVRHPLIFLTVCTANRAPILANDSVHAILTTLWRASRERHGWWVGRYAIMPDLVHLFAMAGDEETAMPLPDWVATWKSISALQLVAGNNAPAPIWQRDYCDRLLRTRESYGAKWDYVSHHPVRAGLASRAEAWPYQGVIQDLCC